MFRQNGHVLRPLSEWRHLDQKDAQSIEQVLSKTTAAHLVDQVAIGRSDHSHVDALSSLIADPLKCSLLQNAEQFPLHRQRDFPHLVQEQRAPVSQLKSAHPIVRRSRE